MITSRQNPRIKQLREVLTRKGRKRTGFFVAEGIHHVAAALDTAAPMETVFYAPSLLTGEFGSQLVDRLQDAGIPLAAVAEDIFSSISGKENPQGILALMRQTWHPIEESGPEVLPWALAVTAPQDPGNIGALLRTLDAVGAAGIILLDGGADPFHPTAVRASMGALFRLRVSAATTDTFLKWTAVHGYTLIGSSARAASDYRQMECTLPAVLLLGSEREGLSPDLQSRCNQMVSLPMAGGVTSLNLAVAGGVLLYQMRACIEGNSG